MSQLVQAEYVREKIEWTYVAFESNVACLELIENKGGILAMLDEECKVPNGKEENFIEKVENNNKANKHFKMARCTHVHMRMRMRVRTSAHAPRTRTHTPMHPCTDAWIKR